VRPKLFAYYLLASFSTASLCYIIFETFFGNRVFGALFRMFAYHWQHPFQYIAIACVTFAIVAALFSPQIARLAGWRRGLATLAVMVGSLVIASVPGGILWSIHDMQAGYFPEGDRFWHALGDGASMGLHVGWLVIALSIPYNIAGLIVGFLIMTYGFRIVAKTAG
jgi:hypothetical protein